MRCTSCDFEHPNTRLFLRVSIPPPSEDVKHQPDFRICPNCGVVFDANLEKSEAHKEIMAAFGAKPQP
jgi:hypothetical protein